MSTGALPQTPLEELKVLPRHRRWFQMALRGRKEMKRDRIGENVR